LTKRQTGNADPTTGNADPTTGGASEDAGDRQLGHALQLWSPTSKPRPKAGEITIIVITAPKSSLFMALSLVPAAPGAKVTVVTNGGNTARSRIVCGPVRLHAAGV